MSELFIEIDIIKYSKEKRKNLKNHHVKKTNVIQQQPQIKFMEKSLSLTIERTHEPDRSIKSKRNGKKITDMNKNDSIRTSNLSAFDSSQIGSIISKYSTSNYGSTQIGSHLISSYEHIPESRLFSDVSSFDDYNPSSSSSVLLFSTVDDESNNTEQEKQKLMNKKILPINQIIKQRKDEPKNNRPTPVLRKTLAIIYKHPQSNDDSIRVCKKR